MTAKRGWGWARDLLESLNCYDYAVGEGVSDAALSEDEEVLRLATVARLPKKCAGEMPPVGEDVLAWIAPSSLPGCWVIAAWFPDQAEWVTNELDKCDNPISYAADRVSHWLPLPADPKL